MLSQPLLPLLEVRHGPLQPQPKLGGMVRLVQVHQFVHYHILGDAGGEQGGFPVECKELLLSKVQLYTFVYQSLLPILFHHHPESHGHPQFFQLQLANGIRHIRIAGKQLE